MKSFIAIWHGSSLGSRCRQVTVPLTPEEIVPWSDQSHTSAPLTRRPRWSWIPLGRPGRSLSEIGFDRRKENAEKVEELSPLGCISQRQPEVEFVFGGCHLRVGAGPRILPGQERSSQAGNHGTTPPYGRELPPGRTRKGEVASDSLFCVFRWIPWLISDPSGAAIGCCWTESAVKICTDLGCRGNTPDSAHPER